MPKQPISAQFSSRNKNKDGTPCFIHFSDGLWGRYYFDTFIDKAKKGEIFKGNKILNKNSGKIGFDTFRLKLVESNWTLIPFLHDFDEVLG